MLNLMSFGPWHAELQNPPFHRITFEHLARSDTKKFQDYWQHLLPHNITVIQNVHGNFVGEEDGCLLLMSLPTRRVCEGHTIFYAS